MPLDLRQTPVLIHVGLHKCASTWLQRSVFGAPDTGFDAPWESMTRRAVTDFVTVDPLEFDAEQTRRAYEAAAPCTPPPERRLVVTHEALSSRPGMGQYYAPTVADRLKRTFPCAKVLILIREQRSIIYSLYNQQVKQGDPRTIAEFIGTGREQPGWAPPCQIAYFKYDNLLRLYRDVFGAENVLMLPMEMIVRDRDGFIGRLSAFAGAPTTDPPADRARGRNASLGAATLAIARRLNTVLRRRPLEPGGGAVFSTSRKLLQRLDRRIPERLQNRAATRLRAFIEERVGDAYVENNARTAAALEIDLSAYGYM